jgi:hypothetical protein
MIFLGNKSGPAGVTYRTPYGGRFLSEISIGVSKQANCIEYVSPGYILVGLDGNATGVYGAIRVSSDEGASYTTEIEFTHPTYSTTPQINTICATGLSDGQFVVGARQVAGTFRGTLYFSDTVNDITSLAILSSPQECDIFTKISRMSTQTGNLIAVATTDSPTYKSVFLTSTSGTSWTERAVFTDIRVMDVIFCETVLIAIADYNSGPKIKIIQSKDGGITWGTQYTTPGSRSEKAYQNTLCYCGRGVVVASYQRTDNTYANTLVSSDYGETWERIDETREIYSNMSYGLRGLTLLPDRSIEVASMTPSNTLEIRRILHKTPQYKTVFFQVMGNMNYAGRRVFLLDTATVDEMQYNWRLPIDFLTFGENGGIYLVCIQIGGGVRDINLINTYDNGSGTYEGSNVETDYTTQYDFDGKEEEIYNLPFKHILSYAQPNISGGLDVNINGSGWWMYTLGIKVVYIADER